MLRIALITPTLAFGGAQVMLCKLLSGLNRSRFAPEVISLTDINPLAEKLVPLKVPLHVLGMKPGVPDPRGILSLSSTLRRIRPHLVLTWMYHCDLLGGIAAQLAGRPPVVWNIRHSNLDPDVDKRSTVLTAKACAALSKFLPKRIISCAETARDLHIGIGYAAEKFTVIPNGFDLSAFRPDPQLRQQTRDELGLKPEHLAIGLVARFHPQKDHQGFIQGAAAFAQKRPDARFVLCGDQVTWENPQLKQWIRSTGVPDRFILLGRRPDMPAVNAAFDIACSASACGEAFSNTLGEAMACSVPCVATQVGDAPEILGDTGIIIPPRNPAALAAALEDMTVAGRENLRRLGEHARERVTKFYSLEGVTTRYEELFESVIDEKRREGKVQWQES